MHFLVLWHEVVPPLLRVLQLLLQITLEVFLKLFRYTRELFNVSQLLLQFPPLFIDASCDSRPHPRGPFPLSTPPPTRFLSWMEVLALDSFPFLLLQGFKPWPEAPCLLPPYFWTFCLPHRLTSKSPLIILQSLRPPPACTSHATTLGCHGSTACSATSSTHSTENRIYTSTPFFHQSRPPSPRLSLLVLSPGSTNPFSAFGNHP